MPLATTVTSKGQVTIPLTFRELLGIKAGQKVVFFTRRRAKTKELVLKPAKSFLDLQGVFAKSGVKYSKKAARRAYIKDVVAGKI